MKPEEMTDSDIKRHAAFLVRLVKSARTGKVGCTDAASNERTVMPIEEAMEIEVRALLGRPTLVATEELSTLLNDLRAHNFAGAANLIEKLRLVAESASKCCVLGVGIQNRGDMSRLDVQDQFVRAGVAYSDLHDVLEAAGYPSKYEGHPPSNFINAGTKESS